MTKESDIITLTRCSEIISFANFLPIEIITVRNTEPIYPVTIGENITCYALDIILMHEWHNEKYELLAQPLIETLGKLDRGVDDAKLWNELFAENEKLKPHLS